MLRLLKMFKVKNS
jgi:signal transduction histidine kinase